MKARIIAYCLSFIENVNVLDLLPHSMLPFALCMKHYEPNRHANHLALIIQRLPFSKWFQCIKMLMLKNNYNNIHALYLFLRCNSKIAIKCICYLENCSYKRCLPLTHPLIFPFYREYYQVYHVVEACDYAHVNALRHILKTFIFAYQYLHYDGLYPLAHLLQSSCYSHECFELLANTCALFLPGSCIGIHIFDFCKTQEAWESMAQYTLYAHIREYIQAKPNIHTLMILYKLQIIDIIFLIQMCRDYPIECNPLFHREYLELLIENEYLHEFVMARGDVILYYIQRDDYVIVKILSDSLLDKTILYQIFNTLHLKKLSSTYYPIQLMKLVKKYAPHRLPLPWQFLDEAIKRKEYAQVAILTRFCDIHTQIRKTLTQNWTKQERMQLTQHFCLYFNK